MIQRWDFQSSSAYQLSLERKTYLISTLMNYVLGFQIISALLFIYTVDDIHKLFVGAMCATGSLNANPVGWLALLSKITVCFVAGFWLVLNYLDQKAEDYPLVRLKYSLLLFCCPLLFLILFSSSNIFLGLDPDIITSCCGSLFSDSGDQCGKQHSRTSGFACNDPFLCRCRSCFNCFAVVPVFEKNFSEISSVCR